LRDKSFCCDDHRRKLTSRSARALREAEDLYGVVTQVKPEDKVERRSGLGTTIFVAASVLILVLVLSQSPGGNTPATTSVSPLPASDPHPGKGGFEQMVGNLMQSKTSGTLRDDFRSGLGDWESFKSAGTDWISDGRHVRPASLRLWKPSTS